MPQVIGRKSLRKHTNDVFNNSNNNTRFSQLFLSKKLEKGLENSGFLSPSPIQLKALPIGLFGSDLIAQAKSGTGKTLVFSIIAIELIDFNNLNPQVLIIAPTREIADQIHSVIQLITKDYNPPLLSVCLIGGIPKSVNIRLLSKGCHIIIGTPGRILDIIKSSIISCLSIKLFVLDEVDKLLELSFNKQISSIYSYLPKNKQSIAVSATYTNELLKKVEIYMNKPQKVLLSADTPSLKGVKQYYYKINDSYSTIQNESIRNMNIFKQKAKKLLKLLSILRFHQCIIFSNQRDFAQRLCNTLTKHGWSNRFISGNHEQYERQEIMEALRSFKLRVLVSTDLTARGVDIEKINLVMNMDIPLNPETYMHRIGRTGRFGTYGVAISFVTNNEYKILENIKEIYTTTIEPLPDKIPCKFYAYHFDNENDKNQLELLQPKLKKTKNINIE